MRGALLAALLVTLALPLPEARAQEADRTVWDFDFILPTENVVLQGVAATQVTLTVKDRSKDGPAGLVPGAPSTTPAQHSVSFVATPLFNQTKGWFFEAPVGFVTLAGETKSTLFQVRADPGAETPYFGLLINATMSTLDGPITKSGTVLFSATGLPGFTMRSGASLELKPNDLDTAVLIVNNVNLQPRTFNIEVTSNPCGMLVGPPASFVVPERTQREVKFSVQAPRDRLWFPAVDCSLGLAAVAIESGHRQATSVSVTVTGLYIQSEWLFWTVVLILFIVLLVLLAKRSRERYDEKIIGKPEKPWLIPVEAVYLRHLREKDPRAWYVVRHHLMEDEYRSALLWFRNYKKATKGTRKKERLVVRHEEKYEAFKAEWQAKIAKPILRADAYEAKLQRKLDRRARRGHRRAVRQAEAKNAKIEAAHAKREERDINRWEAAAAKAQRKGRPAPPRPEHVPAELVPMPSEAGVRLAEHRWSRKAARFRRRMVKRQGNLEVKFEKADARRHAKMHRKVERLARKLDDPQFVAEHGIGQS